MISKIVSGLCVTTFKGEIYVIREPSSEHKVIGEKIYEERLDQCIALGILQEEFIIEKMIDLKMWSDEEQKNLDELPKKIEQMKVDLYECYSNFKNKDNVRKHLRKAMDEATSLISKKNCFRKESAEGFADYCKHKYLVCSNVTDIDGNKIWKPLEYSSLDGTLTDAIVGSYLEEKVAEADIRELSRTEPWRTLWGVGKSSTLFKDSAGNLTAEQHGIIGWSRVYDSIFENPECPPDEVIEDDDLMDGWLIIQSRKRKQEKSKKSAEKETNVRGDEVYFMAESKRDASRVYSLNDANARANVRQKQKQIIQNESIEEQKTLESQIKMRQQANEQFRNKF